MNKEELVKAIMQKFDDKKEISKAEIKKAVQEVLLEESAKELDDDVSKAVTSDAAPADNQPRSEKELDGETSPSIQGAKSPRDMQDEQQLHQQQVPDNIDATQAQGGQQEVSFGKFLGDPLTLGATLKETPMGNMLTNVKPNQMDYIERAKDHKNQSLTEEDLKENTEEELGKSEDVKKKEASPKE